MAANVGVLGRMNSSNSEPGGKGGSSVEKGGNSLSVSEGGGSGGGRTGACSSMNLTVGA